MDIKSIIKKGLDMLPKVAPTKAAEEAVTKNTGYLGGAAKAATDRNAATAAAAEETDPKPPVQK